MNNLFCALLFSALSVSDSGEKSATVSVNLKFSIIPASGMDIVSVKIDEGLYRLAVRSYTSGTENAGTIEKKYLIIGDDIGSVVATAAFDNLKVNAISEDVIVMEWTEQREKQAVASLNKMQD